MTEMRLPPHNIEAERVVISLLILKNDSLYKINDILRPHDFFNATCQIIFKTISELANDGLPYDILTLKNRMEKNKVLERAGGALALSEVLDSASRVANIRYYAEIIKEKSRLRQLISSASNIIESCYNPGLDSRDIIDKAEQQAFNIGQELTGDNVVDMCVATTNFYNQVSKRYTNETTGIKTGFHLLDYSTGGLEGGDLIIVAGRPSMGKTSLAMNIAENVANNGVPVLVFSLEMSHESIVMRMVASRSKVDIKKLRSADITESEWHVISEKMNAVSQQPIYIDDTPGLDIVDLKSTARRQARKNKIGMIVVDYLQLIQVAKRTESRNAEVGHITIALKNLAKELKVPVVLLSQLSRKVEDRPGKKRPRLCDLRDSGNIEQDADLIMFLYRPEYYGETEVVISEITRNAKGLAEVIIAKQRNGPTGSFWLTFVEQTAQFYNIDEREEKYVNDYRD